MISLSLLADTLLVVIGMDDLQTCCMYARSEMTDIQIHRRDNANNSKQGKEQSFQPPLHFSGVLYNDHTKTKLRQLENLIYCGEL